MIAYDTQSGNYSWPPSASPFGTNWVTPTAGDFLFAWVETYSSEVPGIYDTQGNVWTQIGTGIANGWGNYLFCFWAIAAAGTTDQVYFTWTGGSSYPAGQVLALSGVDPVSPINAQAQASGTGTAPAAAVTSTVPGAMFVAACAVQGGASLSAGAGWTQPGGGFGGIYGEESSPGTYSPTFTMTSGVWAVKAVALNPYVPSAPKTAALCIMQ